MKRLLNPKHLVLAIPIAVVACYYALLGLKHLPSVFPAIVFFPLSLVLLLFITIFALVGISLPLLAMLWAVISLFVRMDGTRRHVPYSFLLLIVSFVSAGIFADMHDRLEVSRPKQHKQKAEQDAPADADKPRR